MTEPHMGAEVGKLAVTDLQAEPASSFITRNEATSKRVAWKICYLSDECGRRIRAISIGVNGGYPMLKQFCLMVSLSSVGTLVPWQQDPAPAAPAQETKIPEEAAKKANPVKATPAGMAQAKKLYGYDCAMCHGKSGDGQGDLAADMKLKLLDWRDPGALKDRTDGELFYIIGKGKGQMPAGEQQMKPDEIWMMVNYVRSFAVKTGEPKGKPQNGQG